MKILKFVLIITILNGMMIAGSAYSAYPCKTNNDCGPCQICNAQNGVCYWKCPTGKCPC